MRPPQIRNKSVYMQFSTRSEIGGGGGGGGMSGGGYGGGGGGGGEGGCVVLIIMDDIDVSRILSRPHARSGVVLQAGSRRGEVPASTAVCTPCHPAQPQIPRGPTLDTLHTLFSTFGSVAKIQMFEKQANSLQVRARLPGRRRRVCMHACIDVAGSMASCCPFRTAPAHPCRPSSPTPPLTHTHTHTPVPATLPHTAAGPCADDGCSCSQGCQAATGRP